MIFHNDLHGPGLSRLVQRFHLDMLKAGKYDFETSNLFVRLDYLYEGELVHLGQVKLPDDASKNSEAMIKASFVGFLIRELAARLNK